MRRLPQDLTGPDVTIVGGLVVSVVLAVIGFCLGLPVTPVWFWTVVVGMGVWAAFGSWRQFGRTVVSLLTIAAGTAYTFSYVGTDALGCWFPMQAMMQAGWNPVWESGRASIASYAAGANLSADHIFVYPKLVPIAAAVVGKGLGLLTADAFLAYALMLSLWMTAFRFAIRHWGAFSWIAAIFATAVTHTTLLGDTFVGCMDYDVYAAFLLASLAACLWRREGGTRNLILFVLAEIVLLGAKANGAGLAVLLMIFAVCLSPSGMRRRTLGACGVALSVGLFINLNPLVPVVREFLFGGGPWVELTGDFTGNADAMSLGYFWRMVYAWVSPDLVPGHPVFYVYGDVDGLGTAYRFLLLIAVLCFIASRWTIATTLAVIVFISANLTPLKYVGFGRYCPQMWCIPFLGLFNFAFAPRSCLAGPLRWLRFARLGGIAFAALVTAGYAVRTASCFVVGLSAEAGRQAAVRHLKAMGKSAYLDNSSMKTSSFGLRVRLRHDGIPVSFEKTPDGVAVSYDNRRRSLSLDGVSFAPPGAVADKPKAWISNLRLTTSLPHPLGRFWYNEFAD